MRVLLDHNMDWRLLRLLPGHEATTSRAMGWDEAADGDLLAVAEAEFDALLTGDQNFRYQQNLRGRDIALIILVARRNILAAMAPLVPQVSALLPRIRPGRVYSVSAEGTLELGD